MSDRHLADTQLVGDPVEHPILADDHPDATADHVVTDASTTGSATNGSATNGSATNGTATNGTATRRTRGPATATTSTGGPGDGGSHSGSPSSRRQGGPGGPPPRTSEAKTLLAATIAVGVWHVVLAVATTLLTLLWWPLVEQATSATVQSRGFTFTVSSGVLLLAIVGGSAGSLVHTIAIFTSRVGRRTFETSYVWWYVLRPVGAVLLALIFVTAVSSGLLALSGGDGGSSAALAFLAGALAGLFTDAVLQRLRGLLGATSTEEDASTQAVPLAPRPQH